MSRPEPVIALHTTCLSWGGTEGHVLDLALGFSQRGLRVRVLVDRAPLDRIHILTEAGVKVDVVMPDGILDDASYAKRLSSALRIANPAILHCNCWERWPVLFRIASDLGIPLIETLHTTLPAGFFQTVRYRWCLTRHPLQLRRLKAAYNKYRPATIHISKSSLASFRGLHPSCKRTAQVYCGAFYPESIPNELDHKGPVQVLWAASMIDRKRPMDAVNAWRRIARDIPNVNLTMVGDGPLLPVVRKASASFPEGSITVLGNIPDLRPILDRGQIMLHTASAEGIPKNVRYAMNYGMPVVAAKAGAIPEIIGHGEEGFLTNVGDVFALENSLRALIMNPALRYKMGLKGRQFGRKNFYFEQMFDSVLRAYYELCGVRCGTGHPGKLFDPGTLS